MLPITEGIYDFRTDLRTDELTATTGVGATSANVTLLDDLYGNDIGTVSITSNVTTDVPTASSYNSTSRALDVSGLTASTARTLEIDYDVYALGGNNAVDTLLDWVPYIWIIIIAVFPLAALYALFTGRS